MACSICEKIRGQIGGAEMPTSDDVAMRFQKWVAAPVAQEMDLINVVLTTILVVSVAFLWTRVLDHLPKG